MADVSRALPGAGVDLEVLPEVLMVCSLAPGAASPAWLAGEHLRAYVRTPEGVTVVGLDRDVPEGVPVARNWRGIKVRGPLDFSLVGVLAALVGPLARAGVSALTLSTYETDYVLVRGDSLARALEALREAGHRINLNDCA